MRKNKMMIIPAMCMAAALMMTACGGNAGKPGTETTQAQESETAITVDLSDLLKDIQKAYGEEYIPSMDYDTDTLANVFGLEPDMYEEIIAQGPMITVNIDTFIALKAKAGQAEAAEKALVDYRQDLIDNSLQYPMNLPKLNTSQVIRHGDYVFLVMLGTPTMEALDEGEEAALESAKESNQIAIDVIDEAFGA